GRDLSDVEVEKEQEVSADRADIHVTVKGSSVFSGAEAIHKAQEVNALVEELKALELGPESVLIQGVRAEVASGMFTKSSAASYALRIRVSNLAMLPAVVELVTTRKNAQLMGLEWMYDGLDALLDTWLEALLEIANAKAQRIARRLGICLLGVHSFREERWDPDRPPPITLQHDVN